MGGLGSLGGLALGERRQVGSCLLSCRRGYCYLFLLIFKFYNIGGEGKEKIDGLRTGERERKM